MGEKCLRFQGEPAREKRKVFRMASWGYHSQRLWHQPNQGPEPTNSYSMISSASASNVGGTVTPSALAVVRLMTSSNFVGCSTGISLGLVP